MTRSPDARVTDDPAVEPHVFRSRPDLRPPVMRVTEPPNGTADGLIFLGVYLMLGGAYLCFEATEKIIEALGWGHVCAEDFG